MFRIVIAFLLFLSPLAAQQDIKAFLYPHIETYYKQQGLQGEWQIILDQQNSLLPEQVSLQQLSFSQDHKRFQGHLILKGSVVKFSGRIQFLMEVPVLNRPIFPEQEINESDIIWQKIPTEKLLTSHITTTQELVGKTPKFRVLQPGQLIQRSDVQLPIIIKRGSLVTITYRSGPMVITCRAEAKSDAAKGQLIRLQRENSKRVIEAIALSPGHAEISPVTSERSF
ncbi:MAG: flagellar basal body P-ring formation protein FlgA [Proteobacteria bacterium]|nr:flagellar basal body P-ring formation protein FlgA [Pseudomonadota bacterium]